MLKRYFFLPTFVLMLVLNGCSSTPAGQPISQVRTGQIEYVRVINVKSTTGLGSVAGGVTGGILAGNHIGNGSGSAISSVFGALFGGFLGNYLEGELTQKTAQELTIRMSDTQERIIVVQESPQGFKPGQTVDVITNGQTARVQLPVLQK